MHPFAAGLESGISMCEVTLSSVHSQEFQGILVFLTLRDSASK